MTDLVIKFNVIAIISHQPDESPKQRTGMTARILIAALSCAAYRTRRERCLRTWVPEAFTFGMDVVFLIGGGQGPSRREGLHLYLTCPDDYDSLPQKVRLGFEWAIEESTYDFVFKCDDDTYLRPERLAELGESGADYIGGECTPGIGYASGGAGYLLSRRAMALAAAGLVPYASGAEDLLVGKCLSEAGIQLHTDSRLIGIGNEELRPRRDNNFVSTHGCDAPWKTHRVEFIGENPIVSCSPSGRLGNNLFQVAAALGFGARTGAHVPVFAPGVFGQYCNTIFKNLQYSEIPAEHMSVGDPEDFAFNDRIPDWLDRSVVFYGLMQSEKYFTHCPDLIRRAFAPAGDVVARFYERYGAILHTRPASMHVRRGDFLTKQKFHPVQSTEYFLRSLEELSKRAEISHVLCFSDDLPWCRANLVPRDSRITLVEGQDTYHDLILMSLCAHHIISNSSFSWWGAWLGMNPHKIVIAPDVLLGPSLVGYSDRDMLPDNWSRLSDLWVYNGIHSHGYWVTTTADDHHCHDVRLCGELIKVFQETGGTVMDVGCGPGLYVRSFRESGISCEGFDGNPRTSEFSGGACRVLDFSAQVSLPQVFDWVLSLEVGEHIPRSYEDIFLDNLHRHNSIGVVISWAVEGQGGHGHVNERSNRYIRDRFRNMGYVGDDITERRLRNSISNCSWFRDTIMVFRRQCRSVHCSMSAGDIRLLVGKDDPVILELGCNDGGDTRRFLHEFPNARVHCFEPDERPLARFLVNDPHCTLHRVAIGVQDGTTELFLSGGTPPDQRMFEWDLSSSIHRPTGHLSAHPWCRFDRTTPVQTRSLDSWMREHPEISVIDFLWANIQGAEGDLILGGDVTLSRTRYLYTACSDVPMYEGQPTRRTILEMLPEFECIGVYEGYKILLKNLRIADSETGN